MQIKRWYALGSMLVFAGGLAYAADQTILGNSLTVKNPSTPDKRKVLVKAKEPSTDASIVGDPVASGATLEVRTTGDTPTTQIFPLPAGTSPGNGKPFWTGSAGKGFKYKDAKGVNGPLKPAPVRFAAHVIRRQETEPGTRKNVAPEER